MTLVWKPGYSFDSDASTYIDAVETADGLALETGVRVAINDFVLGCKQDEIWDAINACCILAGARTLDGALVPLVGGAPTNNNFVSGDYDRETGLVSDGNTKYLDSNFNLTTDLDINTSAYNSHGAVYATAGSTKTSGYFGYYDNSSKNFQAINSGGFANIVNMGDGTGNIAGLGDAVGLWGTSRNGNDVSSRVNSTNYSVISPPNSTQHTDTTIYIFARAVFSLVPVNARLAFYSIGESLDLAALDTRVSNLITAIGAAIP
jgi:hypothetical protein